MIITSIVVAGIRNYNWTKLVQSIRDNTKENFEVIFVGPQDLPTELQNTTNIHYYKDFGSANRCQQIGATLACGKYLTWMADDCFFCSKTLQNTIDILEKNKNTNTVVATKYTEGNNIIHGDDYYKMGNAYPTSPFIQHDWWIFNSAVFYREYFEKLGGWDCRFEGTCMAHADLAVRAQRDGANVIMIGQSMTSCGHMPNLTGDHAPMHYAQLYNDEPLFRQLYNDPECVNRIYISLDNWKNSPYLWTRRFTTT